MLGGELVCRGETIFCAESLHGVSDGVVDGVLDVNILMLDIFLLFD